MEIYWESLTKVLKEGPRAFTQTFISMNATHLEGRNACR